MIMKFDLAWFVNGLLASVCLLLLANFIPYFPIKPFSLVGEEVGPRLFIAGLHIHHYIFGIISIIASPILFRIYPNISLFLLGLGIVLFLDELPGLISGEIKPLYVIEIK
jgi:hypothetical protein